MDELGVWDPGDGQAATRRGTQIPPPILTCGSGLGSCVFVLNPFKTRGVGDPAPGGGATHPMLLMATMSSSVASSRSDFMTEYYKWHASNATRWVDSVPLPVGQSAAGAIDWVVKGAVTTPTSQGRCATCQSFSCIADVEGAWFTSGHPLQKLSEQEMIDCAGGDAYGMKWIVHNGGIASIKDAPLANHSDKNLTGCRGITACATVERESAAYINGTTCLTNHVEENILALLHHGPVSVSINAGPLNG